MKKNLILISCSLAILNASSIIVEPSNEKLKMVITNKNIALVNETREFKITKNGMNTIIYKGVPSSLMTDTIVPTFSQKQGKDKTTLYTQKYNYDTINFNNIIKEYLGKNVLFDGGKSGKLISLSPLLIQDNKDEKIKFVKNSDFEITNIPEHLTIKPNLSWNVHTNEGDKKLNLLYLTKGINWEANYTLKYSKEKKEINLLSFITIKNKSGKAYKNVDLKILSGNINIVKPRHEMRMYKSKKFVSDMMDSAPQNVVSQKEFAGYHIYKIPFKVDINDQENSMIKFLDEKNIKARKIYSANISNIFYLHGERKFKFSQAIEFKLDKPLPAGKVTMYQKDKDESIFIGSTRINNTPKNEKTKLRYGENFDLLGKITVKKRHQSRDNSYFKSDFEIQIKNNSDELKKIEFIIQVPTNTRKIEYTSNCDDKNECKFSKLNYSSYKYIMSIKANSKTNFSNHLEFYR